MKFGLIDSHRWIGLDPRLTHEDHAFQPVTLTISDNIVNSDH